MEKNVALGLKLSTNMKYIYTLGKPNTTRLSWQRRPLKRRDQKLHRPIHPRLSNILQMRRKTTPIITNHIALGAILQQHFLQLRGEFLPAGPVPQFRISVHEEREDFLLGCFGDFGDGVVH